MTSSMCHGAKRPLVMNPVEDDILGELNADFRRSKVELIHRFLHDQEELNRRFAEYELDSDEETIDEDREGKNRLQNLRLQESESRLGNILEDLDDITSHVDIENLSTTSAFPTSSRGSLADLADVDNYTCPSDHEEDASAALDSRLKQKSRSPQSSAEIKARQQNAQDQSMHQKTINRNTERKPGSKKNKKILTKKNIRPMTASGFRLQDELDDVQNDDLCSTQTENVNRGPSSHAGNPGRIRTISSWLTDNIQQYTSPVSPVSPVSPISPRQGSFNYDSYHRTPLHPLAGRGSGLMYPMPQNGVDVPRVNSSHRDRLHATRYSYHDRELLSVDLRPPSSCSLGGVASRPGSRGLRNSRYGLDRSGFGGMSSKGYVPPTATSALDNRRSGKRHIAVLKLPPLDVNKTMSTEHHATLVSTTSNNASMPPTAEFLAG